MVAHVLPDSIRTLKQHGHQAKSPKLCVCCMYRKVGCLTLFVFFSNRFLGCAKIYLKDLASGQARSLPCKNVPLVSESGQNIGVSFHPLI